MKLEVTNENYNAVVVEVKNLVSVGLNTLVAFPVFGYQALVPNKTEIGDILILFPAEVQLSEDYCRENDLFRKSELNKTKNAVGYIEDNRRVKAIKLGGQNSTALAIPLSSLSYLGKVDLKVGDTFNSIDGKEICKKYVIKEKLISERGNNVRGKNKKFQRVEAKLFPEHLDTEQYLRNDHKIDNNEEVVITQKLHGSSGRFGHILVNRELGFIERIMKKLGFPVLEMCYDYVAGSRRTVKEIDNKNANHFYKSDIWNTMLDRYKTQIPRGYIIYGEIVGYTPDGGQIQKGYIYECKEGESELYVYRVSQMNPDGIGVDLSHKQVREFCKNNGFNVVPELMTTNHGSFKELSEDFVEVNFASKYRSMVDLSIPFYTDRPIDNGDKFPEEGVCIRVDGLTPYILKMKNQSFLIGESKQLDTGDVDMESNN